MTRKILLIMFAAGLLPLFAPLVSAQTVQTFSYTGGPQELTVPSGVTHATFELFGAQGTGSSQGGRTVTTVTVTVGQVLQINVGGSGNGRTGGWNGGANGGLLDNDTYGGGGGGASDVRTAPFGLGDRIAVAAGGGGNSVLGGGGDGGGTTGLNGEGLGAGGGATQSSGGSGGAVGTVQATSGGVGNGGEGGCYTYGGVTHCGGGGGGGWYGGGGGLAGGAGGGSSWAPAGATYEPGVRQGHGLVVVTFGSGGPPASPGCSGCTDPSDNPGTDDGGRTRPNADTSSSPSSSGSPDGLPFTGPSQDMLALATLSLLMFTAGMHLEIRSRRPARSNG